MEVSSLFFGPLGATFLLGISTLLLSIWNSFRKQSYWKKKGVPFTKPLPLVGNILENYLELQHEIDNRKAQEFGRFWGQYEMNDPVLFVADPELIKLITIKDFQNFVNLRGISTGDSMIDSMLLQLSDEDWKRVRTIMSPTFSTGKLKRMIDIFKECSITLLQNFKNAAKMGEPINVKKFYGALAMDVIASSAFSTKIDSHNDPENQFVKMSSKMFETNNLRIILFLLMPKLCKRFGISIVDPKVTPFFKNTTEQIIKERKRLGQTRNDFLQLLIDAADEATKDEANYHLAHGSDGKSNINGISKKMSMEELVAQCVLFFAAGYETTAQTLTMTSYCLALNPDSQEKARRCVREVLQESKGEITYEAIQDMKYLDQIIAETLRLHSPFTRLERIAESDYKLGDTGITIKKGMMITIPVYAIHRNPKYYPEPEKFDPERFTPEEKAKRDPCAYIPFSSGPRNCLGMRFALLEVKVALAYVLSNFNIKACSKTLVPLKYKPRFNFVKNCDIYLRLEPREDSLIKT